MSQILRPVYTIQQITSTSSLVNWDSIADTVRQLMEGYIVLWQHHAIFTGVVVGGKVTWLNDEPVAGEAHHVRVRAFNEAREYHFWRSGSKMQGRLRTDAPGEGQEVVDTSMMLRGVVGQPLQKASNDLAVNDLAVVTRNYIGHDETTQQVGYVDSRFIKFQPFKA